MNVFAKIGSTVLSPVTFLKQVVLELKAVTWPSRQETARATLIVILASVFVGIYIAILDIGFAKAIEALLSLRK